MSRGMFSGFILVWTTSPKKSPHANKKVEPCKAILLVFAWFKLERRGGRGGDQRTEGSGQRKDCGLRI